MKSCILVFDVVHLEVRNKCILEGEEIPIMKFKEMVLECLLCCGWRTLNFALTWDVV